MNRLTLIAFVFVAFMNLESFAQSEKETFSTHGKIQPTSTMNKSQVKHEAPKLGSTEKVTSSANQTEEKKAKSELKAASRIKPEED